MNPRRLALKVLIDLDLTPKHLEHLLSLHLDKHSGAQQRDRSMAANLVYAVLRHRLRLDYLIKPFVNRPMDKLDLPVLSALRMGVADLVILESPAHAAVDSAVDAAKACGAGRAAGMVNGVLRSLSRAMPAAAQLPHIDEPAARLAITYSHPQWIVDDLLAQWGPEKLEPWLEANQSQQPVTLRANTLRTSRGELKELLADSVDAAFDHPLAPDGLIIKGSRGPLELLPGFDDGLWQAQDAGAQALSRLLGVLPGMKVLDLCAGAGGKTGHLAALMQNRGEVVAVDKSPGRIRALRNNMARLGAEIVRVAEADGQDYDPRGLTYDAILVDAPCSGLGVLGRRPDARWRRSSGDSRRLAELQLRLLGHAARMLASGGALLYCTCTVTKTENEDVVGRLLDGQKDLQPDWQGAETFGCLDDDGFWRSFPRSMQADSFFAARLVRRS